MDERGFRLKSELCSMSASDADKLIECGDGDCALLYIYLMRRGAASPGGAQRALKLTPQRLKAASDKLLELGLISDAGLAGARADVLPEYIADEIVRRSGEDKGFRDVLAECERVLGHPLTGADTRTLFGIYDFLGLPVDVMMLLMHHCAEECRLNYGPGRVPTVRQREKDAYVWANREIMTFEQAEEYIRARARMREAAEEVKRALGISGRDFTPTERKYVESSSGAT